MRRYREFAGPKSELERQAEGREKTGVFTGAFAINPTNGAAIPIFVADYVLMGYGTGAIMAVPGQDERDWEFAEVYDLPIIRTVQPTEGFEGRALDVISGGLARGVSERLVRRAPRLLQGYELLYWDTLYWSLDPLLGGGPEDGD